MAQYEYQQQIKHWVESHQGKPVLFDFPDAQADKKGVRIDFPGETDEVLHNEAVVSRPISWEEFFEYLDQHQLVFMFDDPVDPEVGLVNSYRFERAES